MGIISSIGSLISGNEAANGAKGAASVEDKTATANLARSQPYVDAGYNSANLLDSINSNGGFTAGQTDYLTGAAELQPATPQPMTQAQLETTPGYQFQLNQGLQSTQNSAAARGLGVSGAALKGAATYATGLANSNYQQQFQNAQSIFGDQQTQMQNSLNLNTAQQTNNTNRYNQLQGAATLGANAASNVATNQTTAATAQGNFLNAAGQASAAGTQGAFNGLVGGANSAQQAGALSSLAAF
jgi:hypothetical protein